MIKKYVLVPAVLLIILLFTSTSTASLLSSKQSIYERFQENSVFGNLLEKISQIVSYNDNNMAIEADSDDEDDLMDSDGPEEDVLLPEETVNVDGEITPDDGNELVVEDGDLGDNPTIDIDGKEGATLNDEVTVETDGEEGRTLVRIIDIITENNEKIGAMLQKVVERTFAPGTTESEGVAENIVDTVVVVEGSEVTAENSIVENVVVTVNEE